MRPYAKPYFGYKKTTPRQNDRVAMFNIAVCTRRKLVTLMDEWRINFRLTYLILASLSLFNITI